MRLSLRIKNFIGSKILKNSYILNSLYNKFYLLRNKSRFLNEVNRREKLSIFEYKELSQELPFCPFEFVKDSNFYGYANAIKKYAQIEHLNYSLEHGLYYRKDYITSASFSRTIKQFITLSDDRKQLLESKTKKKAHAIGPYIHYAPSLLSDVEKANVKQKYGKILLLMPSHSDVEDECIYDINFIIDKVNHLKEKYSIDTVFVCLFYHDVLYTDYGKYYEEAGYKIVTAGHRYDLNFVSRLRSIIEMSDITVSNGFGTNLGYCVYLNKPHIMYQSIVDDEEGTMADTLCKEFSTETDVITERQFELVSKYWGFNNIRTPQELYELLKD